jgi:prepilin-type N-terminal cleavage/methylation domain-containing protein
MSLNMVYSKSMGESNKLSRGFTLMELLVVIAILGVLIVAGLGSFTSSQKKSRDVKRKSDLRQISLALETYYNDFGSYPLADSSTHKLKGCGVDGTSTCEWGSPWKKAPATGTATVYMIALPADPSMGHSYYYDSDGTYFRLYANLENEKDEGAGVQQSGYGSLTCGGSHPCTYGISSPNVAVD